MIEQDGPEPKSLRPQRKVLLGLLSLLVGLEALVVIALAMYFLFQIFTDTTTSYMGAIVIFAISLTIGLCLSAIALAIWKSRSWVRGAVLTWQILQFGAATSFIKGIGEWQLLGWLLVFLALATTIVMFLPQVTQSFSDES